LSTAFNNDVDPTLTFAQQTYGYGRPGDVLMGISTSGNSTNIIKALWVAKALGVKTVGLTGRSGGEMASLCDIVIKVPALETYAVQELHLPVYHCLCSMIEAEVYSE
jgi:D-sedoheptulose 7-phosphate isomerase